MHTNASSICFVLCVLLCTPIPLTAEHNHQYGLCITKETQEIPLDSLSCETTPVPRRLTIQRRRITKNCDDGSNVLPRTKKECHNQASDSLLDYIVSNISTCQSPCHFVLHVPAHEQFPNITECCRKKYNDCRSDQLLLYYDCTEPASGYRKLIGIPVAVTVVSIILGLIVCQNRKIRKLQRITQNDDSTTKDISPGNIQSVSRPIPQGARGEEAGTLGSRESILSGTYEEIPDIAVEPYSEPIDTRHITDGNRSPSKTEVRETSNDIVPLVQPTPGEIGEVDDEYSLAKEVGSVALIRKDTFTVCRGRPEDGDTRDDDVVIDNAGYAAYDE